MDPGSSAAGGSFELLARNQRFTPLQSSRSSNLGNSHSNHNDASEQWDTDTEASPLLGKGKKPVGRQGTGGASPPIGKVEEPGGSQRRSHIEPISVPPPELPTGPGLVDERGNTLPLEGAANVPEILEGAVQPEGNIVTYKEYRLKERPAENTDPDTVKVDRSKGVIIDLGYVLFVRHESYPSKEIDMDNPQSVPLLIASIQGEWEAVISGLRREITAAGTAILAAPNSDSNSTPGRILRFLSNVSDASDQLETDALLLSRQYQSLVQGLGNNASTTGIADLSRIRETVASELIKKVDSLFQRASNIMSIDEAYLSRTQNASLKRLSWITFIFLPLLFVASLFGMNVDILENNPDYKLYLYVSIPMFFIMMVGVLLWKYWTVVSSFIRNRNACILGLHGQDPELGLRKTTQDTKLDAIKKACRDGKSEAVRHIFSAIPKVEYTKFDRRFFEDFEAEERTLMVLFQGLKDDESQLFSVLLQAATKASTANELEILLEALLKAYRDSDQISRMPQKLSELLKDALRELKESGSNYDYEVKRLGRVFLDCIADSHWDTHLLSQFLAHVFEHIQPDVLPDRLFRDHEKDCKYLNAVYHAINDSTKTVSAIGAYIDTGIRANNHAMKLLSMQHIITLIKYYFADIKKRTPEQKKERWIHLLYHTFCIRSERGSGNKSIYSMSKQFLDRLFDVGANVDSLDGPNGNQTILMLAVVYGQIDIFAMLLRRGASILPPLRSESLLEPGVYPTDLPFHSAVKRRRWDILEQLCEIEAVYFPLKQSPFGDTDTLHVASSINLRNNEHKTALYIAVELLAGPHMISLTIAIKNILAIGADPNIGNANNLTPLMYSTFFLVSMRHRSTDPWTSMLKTNAATALWYALTTQLVDERVEPITKRLLQKGADISLRDTTGATIVHSTLHFALAVCMGYFPDLTHLGEDSWRYNTRWKQLTDKLQNTSHLVENAIKVIELLSRMGIRLDVRDSNGLTVLEYIQAPLAFRDSDDPDSDMNRNFRKIEDALLANYTETQATGNA